MHDGSAHPATSTSLKKVSQLGEFFRHSLDDWVKAISRKGFISLQVSLAPIIPASACNSISYSVLNTPNDERSLYDSM